MSSTSMNVPKPLANVSVRRARERKQTLHLGTYADGQRASPVTVIHSAHVGSFGDAGRK